MKNQFYIFLAGLAIFLTSCNALQREVDLNLPEFESELVIECYLEPGQPYRAILSETTPFFGNVSTELPNVEGATIIITHNGVADTLMELDTLQIAFTFFLTGKLYNYGSTTIVPEDFDNDFTLEVYDTEGRQLNATTRLLPKVALDSIEILPPLNDSTYTFLTYFPDNPDEANYYYRTTHRTQPIGDSLKTAFLLDDQFPNVFNQIVAGGPPLYEFGDTVIVSVFHVTEAFNDFIQSTTDAENNNGNPFGQPGSITSNVVGGQGIFTGLAYDRKTYYIE